MNKKDKLITIFGVLVLIGSAVGVYLWYPPSEIESEVLVIQDFFGVSSSFSILPSCIEVPDNDPFYPLIATPLAVNYNQNGEQHVVPLYVENYDNPSSAVVRAYDMIGIERDLLIEDTISPEQLSINIAKGFWKKSDAVLIIKNDQSGYNLGVLATPLASYLSIPVIVVDELDNDVKNVLKSLGVKKSLVCGDVQGFGKVLKFDSVDDVVNSSVDLVKERFGEVNYITLTNSIDTYEPEVLDRTEALKTGPVTLPGISSLQIGSLIKLSLTNGLFKKYGVKYNSAKQNFEIGSFKIPEDYKYALVKFEGINYQTEGVDLFGDCVSFNVKGTPMKGYQSSTNGYPNVYDSNGKTELDVYYCEHVYYDMGGEEFPILLTPAWTVAKEGKVEVNVVIEKLSDPLYPMMKNLSSVSPYLTAYRKGIIFGKPEFAFTADDDVLTDNGEKCSGLYMSRYNTKLKGPSNTHMFNDIHLPLNKLLANLADMPTSDLDKHSKNLEDLRSYYEENPVYICLVGGATVLPQYVYDSVVNAGGLASDHIYGNIDPLPTWVYQSNDYYTKYPVQENVVGRITGWDTQDVSALIARTVFYDNIIEKLDDWKNTASVQAGCNTDFIKPKFLMKIAEALGTHEREHKGYEEPLRWYTGCSDFSAMSFEEISLKPMGYNVKRTSKFASMLKGLSNEAIKKIKTASLLNLISVSKFQLKNQIGEKNVKGGENQLNSNFIFIHGHGSETGVHLGNEDKNALGMGYIFLPQLWKVISRVVGMGPAMSIGIGDYTVRAVEKLNMGPSYIFLQTCLAGWIDGRYPKTCFSQAYLHSGVNALFISTTQSLVPGGYLEPYKPYSTMLGIIPGYINATRNAKNGIYPEHHFGEKMCEDILHDIHVNDATVGMALRNAKNRYLPEDADWELYWTPPLGKGTGNNVQKGKFMDHKYVTIQEFHLYGDPMFTPYVPDNNQ